MPEAVLVARARRTGAAYTGWKGGISSAQVRGIASPLRTERLAQVSLCARRQGFPASRTEPGRTRRRRYYGRSNLARLSEGFGDARQVECRGIRRGRVVRTRPVRKPSRQDHPESRSSRAAILLRGGGPGGMTLGRAPCSRSGSSGVAGVSELAPSRHEPRPAFKEVTRK